MIIFLLVIVILLVSLYFYNRNFINSNEYYSNPVYIFWTGGYDSTFRLCQLLIVERAHVQPIYISAKNLDNVETGNTKRHNHKNEFQAMEKIRKMLNEKFPFTKEKLRPTIVISDISIDDDIKQNMKVLKNQRRVRRSTCQYGGMAQVTRDLDKHIEVSIEKAEHVNGFYKTIYKKLGCSHNCNYRDHTIKSKRDKPLRIFEKFVFPIIHISKKKMYVIAKQNDFADILGLTWSCWYPKNNKPCNRCIMCRERLKFV